jgi:magnesium chelatase subunit I
VRDHFRGVDLGALVEAIEDGASVVTGAQVSAREFLAGLPALPPSEAGEADAYDRICERLGAEDDGSRASAIELALEGLYLARRVAKESGDGETVYG